MDDPRQPTDDEQQGQGGFGVTGDGPTVVDLQWMWPEDEAQIVQQDAGLAQSIPASSRGRSASNTNPPTTAGPINVT